MSAQQLLAQAKAAVEADPDAALDAAEKADELFKAAGDKSGCNDVLRVFVSATLAKGEHENAQQMATQELELARQEGDGSKEACMLMTLAEVHLYLGYPLEALKRLKAARGMAFELGDSMLEGKVAMVEAQAHMSKGDIAEAAKAANQALSCCQKAKDKEGEAEAWGALSNVRMAGGTADVLDSLKKALGLYRELRDKSKEAATLVSLAQAQLGESAEDSLRSAKEAMSIYKAIESQKGEAQALMAVVRARISKGEPEEAIRLAKDRLAACGLAGAVLFLPVVVAACVEGEEPDDALQAATEALESAREEGGKSEEAWMLNSVAEANVAKKEYEEAESAAQEAYELFMDCGERAGEAAAASMLTQIYTLKGEAHKAPHRQMGIHLLGKLSQAVANKDKATFDEVFHQLYVNLGVDKQDLEATLKPVFKKDPTAEQFFSENAFGFYAIEGSAKGGSHNLHQAKNFDRIILFMGMRFGGMGYGPSFRSVHATWRKGDPYNVANAGTRALSVIKDETMDTWEEVAMYQAHPGIMDAALQVQGLPFSPDPGPGGY